MKRTNKYLIFLVFLSFQIMALSNQYILGDIPDIEISNKGDSNSYYLSSSELESLGEPDDKNKTPFLPNNNLKQFNSQEKMRHNNFGQGILGDRKGNSVSTLNYNDKEFFYKNYNNAKSAFSFSYYMDNYDISDSGNIFNKTFSDNGTRSGYLIFAFDHSIFRSRANFLWGFDIGFSYSHGNGIFKGGDISNTDIKFWIIPLEFYLKLEVPIWTWSKISILGGPSLIGIWQTRADMDQGESVGNAYQSRRQIGYGYFAGAKLSLSLSRWLKSSILGMNRSFSVNNFYLTFEGRLQNYGNFLDPLEIKGLSYGIGFAFDFL